MHLDEALRQITDIRQQMARGEVCRGFRAGTLSLSGLAGLLAAAAQARWIASPQQELGRYLSLWILVAAFSIAVASIEIFWRTFRAGPGLARRQAMLAAEHFLPSLVVGALLTMCIFHGAPHVAWMLPGLWSLIFGLGVFAASRLFPPQMLWVGLYYILCGVGCLLWGQGEYALSPWTMAISFGGGQMAAAAVLYWTLERHDGAQTDR